MLLDDELLIQNLNKGEEFWSFQKDCERDYVHGIFAYPAMMVPQMQREIIKVFKDLAPNDKMILFDPFMGSGTIMVEGMLQGADILGIDINPLAYLVSKVKTTIYSLEGLSRAIKMLKHNIDYVEKTPVETSFDNIDKWFKSEIIVELDHIKKQIQKESSIKVRRFMWVAFSETIRLVCNSRSSTYKLHIKEKEVIDSFDRSAIDVFKNTIDRNYLSTKQYQEKLHNKGFIRKNRTRSTYSGNIEVCLGDSLKISNSLCKKYKPNIIITSPPYGDNHTTVTYGQYSILSLRWIDLDDISKHIDKSVINSLSQIDKMSMGGSFFGTTDSNDFLNVSTTLQEECKKIRDNDTKKENKVLSFYSDFYKFIGAIQGVCSNTYVVMTIGNRTVAKNRIKMDQILEQFFNHFGFDLVYKFKRNILNKRMPVNNHTNESTGEKSKTMTKEYVLILKKR